MSKSEAVKSGLLEDLEDTILMVEGIDVDIISDVTTNIIREPLIRYTQDARATYGIPLVPGVNSGPLWDPARMEWYAEFVSLPVAEGRKLLLVPKVLVRRKMDYDSEEYYREYLLEYLQEVELSANSELVQLLKNGHRRVTKKSLEAKYGKGKAMIVRETRLHPEVLERYRADKKRQAKPPLSHDEIAETEGTPPPDWNALLATVRATPPGREHADAYEKAIEKLLTALFYPALSNPQLQHELHHGRKRIDLTYTNVASSGFFRWLASHYAAPHVFVECKNYAGDPGNPELDQLSGRFSPSRGQFGFCVALAANNVLATAKGALRAVHGTTKVEEEVSNYQMAVEVAGKYQGMMIALPAEEWAPLAQLTHAAFAQWLKGIARHVKLQRYRKRPRGPKKPRPRRTRFAKAKHVSTARLLAETRSKK